MEPLLPLIVVVIGWAVVNHQHNRRETRKEGRALIDSAKKIAVEVSRQAVDYYCEADKGSLSYDIKAALEALEIELERTPHFLPVSPLMYAFLQFSEAITGGSFEKADRQPVERSSSTVSQILATRNALLSELERQFRVHYL